MKLPRMLRFYTWLKHWATRKEKEVCQQHNISGFLKCPRCNTWDANMPNHAWADMQPNTPTMQHDRFKCGKCLQWTTFLDLGIVRTVDDPDFPRTPDENGRVIYD